MEDLMGMFHPVQFVTNLQVALAAFEFTPLHVIEVRPNKRNPPNLPLYMKSKYLLMSPYLEGSKFEKISGDTGERLERKGRETPKDNKNLGCISTLCGNKIRWKASNC
jgi:hypothetical protein